MRYEPTTKAHTAASREPVQPAAHSTTNSTIGATIRYGFHGSRKVPTPRHKQNRPMAVAAHKRGQWANPAPDDGHRRDQAGGVEDRGP